jgi:hypothetical protein
MATYVLIPGGGGDPWEWHRLVLELEARGHDALAVRLPAEDDTAGWSEYADAVIDAVGDRIDLIVVAESMGGFTAPIVCTRRAVDVLVLLNAMIPVPGEAFNGWWSNTDSGAARRAYGDTGIPHEQVRRDPFLQPDAGHAPGVPSAGGGAVAADAAALGGRRGPYGPSLHDDDSYYLIRAYASLEDREQSQDAFYSSSGEWRGGPRQAILDCIESDTSVVIKMAVSTIDGLRN